MGQVIGDLLPLALAVAISPIPIIAVILMLFAPRAGGTSAGFLLGWLAGILVVVVAFVLLAGTADLGSSTEPSAFVSWVKLLLGLVLLLFGARQWRGRPRPGETAKLPKWMSAIDKLTTGRAVGLGAVLAIANPKNLPIGIAAGVTIAGGSSGEVVAVIVYTLLAVSTVAIPVLGYAVAADRMRGPLDQLKAWLETNNATVMSLLLLVMGVVVLGKGLGGLL